MEDLHELGIAYEDIKASFCKKAKRNISNTQVSIFKPLSYMVVVRKIK